MVSSNRTTNSAHADKRHRIAPENYALFRAIGHAWPYLKDGDKRSLPERFESPRAFWKVFAAVASEYPSAYKDVLTWIENDSDEVTAATLGFVAVARPKSRLLFQMCLETFQGDRGGSLNLAELDRQRRASQIFAD